MSINLTGNTYPKNREQAFADCKKALRKYIVSSTDDFIVANGDSLELMALLPPESVSLVLTDPPYHSTQKENIYGDTQFKKDQEYLDWLRKYGDVWLRTIRKNGALYVFCSMKLAAHIEVMFSSSYNCLSHITWTKPNEPGFDGWKGKVKKTALRSWYPHTERVLFLEPAYEGNLRRSTFGAFLRAERTRVGMSTYDLAEITESYGKVNHGGAVSNWEAGRNVPSREQYRRIVEAFAKLDPGTTYPAYEDVIRPFHANGDMEFTDAWNYRSVKPYKGKHPAEKPLDMLDAMVRSSSYPGDVVVDCFGGSGSTGAAAVASGRKAIILEIEQHWCEYAAERLHGLAGGKRPGKERAPVEQTGAQVELIL